MDFDKLKQFLSEDIVEGRESYEFTWVGKREAIAGAGRPTTKTLRPDLDESVDFENSENVFITGDNLEILKILQESYLGKVDMIYIDPPYNTGKDFVYSDKFQKTTDELEDAMDLRDEKGRQVVGLTKNEKSSARYHSDWLNMMYPRLRLARNLLKDSGVIFISIDDNEQAHLKVICDEIFGEENFVVNLAIENNPKGRKNGKFVSINHESLLIYAKNIGQANGFKEIVKKDNLLQDEYGYYTHGKRVLVGESTNSIAQKNEKDYSVYYNGDNIILETEDINHINDDLVSNGYTVYKSIKGGKLLENTYTKDTFKDLFSKHSLLFKENSIYEKDRNVFKQQKSLIKSTDEWDLKTETASFQCNGFNSKELFSMPKNPQFIRMLLSLFGKSDAIVLDFFGGSGTTAHSVYLQNTEDGGNRKYILCTLGEEVAEKSVAKDAGYETIDQISRERIRRAAKKIQEEHPETVGKQDFGFKAYRLDSSNFKDVTARPDETVQGNLFESVSNIKDGRTSLDILFQVMLAWGMDLSLSIKSEKVTGKKIHNVAEGSLIACFEEDLTEEVIRHIAGKKPLRVVFCDSSFAKSADKINLTEIFKEISPQTKVKVV
ncbi:site-specific DNA-methyltransferase [Streptococcus danieliae]|uniref:site-specific DNA-methyltransferase n=1 Tax=Streptococcus danieliae TaxID=747656 RepID=UPI00359F8CAF